MYALMPHLNAFLNAASALFLAIGFVQIRRKNRDAHRRCMIGALCSSALFLVSYLVYHAQVGSVRFLGTGTARTVYFTILASHTLLAAVVAPLAIAVATLALRGRLERHKRLARVTLPIWLTVSVTGVAVYAMLYHLYPNSLGGR